MEDLFRFHGLQNRSYRLFPLPSLSDLPQLLEDKSLSGLNVTLPWKSAILPFLNEMDPLAKLTGAVNCIRIEHRSQGIWLKGFNTDVQGFQADLLDWNIPKISNALLLGNGGAAKAVALALNRLEIPCSQLARNPKETNELPWAQAPLSLWQSAQLIVHATPAGMQGFPDQMPWLPKGALDMAPWVYDLVYQPPETALLAFARQKNCLVRNGLGMLKRQAALALECWENPDSTGTFRGYPRLKT